jgi:hypothetical protein
MPMSTPLVRLNRLLAPLVSLAALAPACSRSEAHDAGGPFRAEVRIALTFSRAPSGIRFEGQGHFARFAEADADRVPTLLGLADDESIPLDTCRLVDSAEALDHALAAGAEVALLDAGKLTIKGPVDFTTLLPKHYPELTPYVAGVVYGTDDALPLALEPGAVYEVLGEGGEEIGPFQSQGQAPRAFPSVEVPSYRRGTDLDLRWSEAGEVSEPMVLVVAWSSRAGAREVRCRVRDDGSFTVPRELLAALPPAHQLALAEVAAIRSRRSPIAAPGVARGTLAIALEDAAPLQVSTLPSLAPRRAAHLPLTVEGDR